MLREIYMSISYITMCSPKSTRPRFEGSKISAVATVSARTAERFSSPQIRMISLEAAVLLFDFNNERSSVASHGLSWNAAYTSGLLSMNLAAGSAETATEYSM